MAVYRAASGRGNHEIQYGESQRGYKESDSIVDPQSAERRARRTRNEFRHDVAHWIGKQGEHQSANDVPARHIEVGKAFAKERWQKLQRRQQECQHHEDIHKQRKLGPFQGLTHSGQYQSPARQHDNEVPDSKQGQPEIATCHRAPGEHGHCMVEKG